MTLRFHLTGGGQAEVGEDHPLPVSTSGGEAGATEAKQDAIVAALSPVANRETWRVSALSFTTANLSTVTWTVPADTEYEVLWVRVAFTSTSDAGNRQLCVQVLDASDNILLERYARVTQAASLTRYYHFAQGVVDDTAFYNTAYAAISLPRMVLAAGQKLKVFDAAAVAAAADDMVVRVQIASRSVV